MPKFTMLWQHPEEILLLNNFFPVVDMCLSCEDIARQSCMMVPRWRLFGNFCVLISSEPRAARFRRASQIRTKATPRVEVWQTSNLRPLRLGDEKKERKRKKEETTG